MRSLVRLVMASLFVALPRAASGRDGENSGIVGTGVTVQFAPRWRAFVNYDAEVRGGNVTHIGSGGIKVIW
jgi:hypothetical protein